MMTDLGLLTDAIKESFYETGQRIMAQFGFRNPNERIGEYWLLCCIYQIEVCVDYLVGEYVLHVLA